jgi:16S rRNA (guanine527-N7)-methyltransferase
MSVTAQAAAGLFGERLPVATRYADWLTGEGVRRGLIGPREAERIWPRHLVNCAVVAATIPPSAHVVDLGSGAGLPGIALAIARPDLEIVLVESLLRRATFLTEVVADLCLAGVTVRRIRAEELAGAALDADVVTARAVTSLAGLCRWAGPLLSARGFLLAIKGDGVIGELASDWSSIRSSGFSGDVELLAFRLTQPDSAGNQAPWRNVYVDSLACWSSREPVLPADSLSVELGHRDNRAATAVRLYRSQSAEPPLMVMV